MNSGIPTATTRISACAKILFRFLVFEWQMVTVAFLFKRSMATGLPTLLERPTMTACFPAISIWDVSSIVMMPFGVQHSSVWCP